MLNIQNKIINLYNNKSIKDLTIKEIENLVAEIKNLSLEHYGVIETQIIKSELSALAEFVNMMRHKE